MLQRCIETPARASQTLVNRKLPHHLKCWEGVDGLSHTKSVLVCRAHHLSNEVLFSTPQHHC